MSVVKIGYWNCRGLIEPIRLLLEYAGTPYEFTGQECGPAPHYDKVVWMAKKSTVLKDYDFPNLPYYDDGEGIKLTHSVAIVQHLGRTYGLVPPPDSVREWADLDLYREQILELRDAVVNYVYFSEHRAKVRD
jgi:glutathione S-transferase